MCRLARLVTILLPALLLVLPCCSGKKERKKEALGSVRAGKPTDLTRFDRVELVALDGPPSLQCWLRIPGEWYGAEGLTSKAFYRYEQGRRLAFKFTPVSVAVNGRVVGLDLRDKPLARVKQVVGLHSRRATSVTLKVTQAQPALWQALSRLTGRELFIHLVASHEPGQKPADPGPVLSRLAALQERVVGLALSGKGFGDRVIGSLAPLKRVRFLKLEESTLSAAGLGRLVRALPGLETLLIDWADPRQGGITDEGLAQIARLGRLQRLAVNGAELTQLGALKRLRFLRVLDLTVRRITSRDLAVVGELSGLRWLHIWFQQIRPQVLEAICRLKSLRVLQISPDVPADRLGCLAGLAALRALALHGSSVTDAALKPVGKLRKLVRLDLSAASLGGQGLGHLAGLESLRELDLMNQRGGFEPANLVHVARLRSLESLNLAGTPVDDPSLAKLHSLKKLRSLVLFRTGGVTPEGVAAVKKALPGCAVEGPR